VSFIPWPSPAYWPGPGAGDCRENARRSKAPRRRCDRERRRAIVEARSIEVFQSAPQRHATPAEILVLEQRDFRGDGSNAPTTPINIAIRRGFISPSPSPNEIDANRVYAGAFEPRRDAVGWHAHHVTLKCAAFAGA
jgi:hypothetical protein